MELETWKHPHCNWRDSLNQIQFHLILGATNGTNGTNGTNPAPGRRG